MIHLHAASAIGAKPLHDDWERPIAEAAVC
jgi:hypothetical protein